MPRVESSAANDSHVLSALETHQSTVTSLVHESGTQQQIVEQLQSRIRQVLHHMTSCTYNIQEVERCHKLHVKCIFFTSSQLAKDQYVLMYVRYDMQEGSPQKTLKQQSEANL